MAKAKRKKAIPTKVVDEDTRPLDIEPLMPPTGLGPADRYPIGAWARDPEGEIEWIEIIPGHDGPFIVEDGYVVANRAFPGWTLVGQP